MRSSYSAPSTHRGHQWEYEGRGQYVDFGRSPCNVINKFRRWRPMLPPLRSGEVASPCARRPQMPLSSLLNRERHSANVCDSSCKCCTKFGGVYQEPRLENCESCPCNLCRPRSLARGRFERPCGACSPCAQPEASRAQRCAVEECATQECSARTVERDVDELRCELQALERMRDGMMRENRRLQDDLACSARDVCQANANLTGAREEVETLKRQLQEYVAEIRRVEDQLATKENERSEMLEHFRGLTVEATMLETNNHTLESESQETKRQLCTANERIDDLQQQLGNRDSLVQSYENQIQELTANIAKLETQLQEFLENRQTADRDVEELRMLCMKLDSQKDDLKQQIQQHDMIKIQLESELSHLQDQQEHMQEHLCRDRSNIASLESMLASSRKETSMQRKINDELKSEVRNLQQKVNCLQAKLESETAELERCQYQATEYRNQIKELQHQVTNERFEKARATEEQKRPSDPCPRNKYPSNQACTPSLKCGNSWEEKTTSVMCNSGGSCRDVPGNRKSYLAPPPCSDWDGLRAALDRECSTYTTEPGSPRQGPCNKSCPFIPRPRPTYVTGPRPASPKDNVPPEGAGSQSMFLNAKDSTYLNRSQFTSPKRPMSYTPNYGDSHPERPQENKTKSYPCSIPEPPPSCREDTGDASYSTTL